MNSKEYIESGILELYVFGKLSEEERHDVQRMAADNPAIRTEIAAIEKAVMALSYSISPNISSKTYDKIRLELLGSNPEAIQQKQKKNWTNYFGWAASCIILLGAGFMYLYMNNTMNEKINIEINKSKADFQKMRQTVTTLEQKNKANENVLQILRDKNNHIISLEGQTAMPSAAAKAYWNRATKAVYIDANNLPEPPQGMVYQAWAFKMNPLTPSSIGLMDRPTTSSTKLYRMDNTAETEAFGITLEPEGGNATPSMEQLYVFGKI